MTGDIDRAELTGPRCGRFIRTKTGLTDMCGLSYGHDVRVEAHVPTHVGARSGIEFETGIDTTGKKYRKVTRWPDPARAAAVKRGDRAEQERGLLEQLREAS
jgi:hypothetical protein